jgi:hypothetical protein
METAGRANMLRILTRINHQNVTMPTQSFAGRADRFYSRKKRVA